MHCATMSQEIPKFGFFQPYLCDQGDRKWNAAEGASDLPGHAGITILFLLHWKAAYIGEYLGSAKI